jgi:hypothetical protein
MEFPAREMHEERAKSQTAARDTRRRVLVAILVVLVIAVIALVVRSAVSDHFTIENARPVVSQVDGLRYRVHESHTGSQRAADTLAALNARVVDLMRFLRARYIRGPDGKRHPARRGAVERLLARYNPDHLAENSPRDPTGDTSYTLDKGAVIAICLRERDPSAAHDDIHDFRTLMFVTLHEMGHIAIDDIDHPPRFWSAFKFLLEEAEEAGILDSPDFAARPRYYCGVKIDYNPRFDGNTVSL